MSRVFLRSPVSWRFRTAVPKLEYARCQEVLFGYPIVMYTVYNPCQRSWIARRGERKGAWQQAFLFLRSWEKHKTVSLCLAIIQMAVEFRLSGFYQLVSKRGGTWFCQTVLM